MSHFAINIFASLSASANAWITWDKHLPIWLMVPAEAVFLVVSFTDSRTPPFLRHRQNDKSKIDQKSFDLCGIAAIGDIFRSFGGLSLMESHCTKHAWFICTFSGALAAKCAIASGESTEQCGPLATASHILVFNHGLPVFVGHPSVAHSCNKLAVGCWIARPVGHMEFWWGGQAAWLVGFTVSIIPWYCVHGEMSSCLAHRACHCCLLLRHICVLSSLSTTLLDARTRRPRWLDFQRDSWKMFPEIAPGRKFLLNFTESRHRIAPSFLENSLYLFLYI